MDRKLIYEDEKGNCVIIHPFPSFQSAWEKEEMALSRLYEVSIPEVAEFIACNPNQLPRDLTFREAWKKGDKDQPIKVDLNRCLEIHRKRLAQAAEKKIQQLDKQLEIALENENTPEAVAIRGTKRILRQIHNMNLTHCKTPEDVKWSIPQELQNVWDFYTIP